MTRISWAHEVKPDYRPPPPLKAGYAVPSFGTRIQVYSCTFSRYRSPRGEGLAHMPLWIAPTTLLPAQAPNWASAANTRNFIDVPFNGFLAPSSKLTALTRILRHL